MRGAHSAHVSNVEKEAHDETISDALKRGYLRVDVPLIFFGY